jgi:hypothetical protein
MYTATIKKHQCSEYPHPTKRKQTMNKLYDILFATAIGVALAAVLVYGWPL